MILSHTHKFIFIKSYKTAGTSVEAALSQFCSSEDIVTDLGDYSFNRDEKGKWIHRSNNPGEFHQHDNALTIKKAVSADVWKEYFKFSITRNPWDRAVSLFFWENRRNTALVPRKRFYHYLGIPFDELHETRKLFTEFIKGDWTNNDCFYSVEGHLCVDFVIRYEKLAEDFEEVCRSIGAPSKEIPHLKSGIRKRAKHYSEYYNDESRAIVAERSQNDIRLFGYEFEKNR